MSASSPATPDPSAVVIARSEATRQSRASMALPPLSHAALLLDLDGTLLDIAPTPDAVVVPPDLLISLAYHYVPGSTARSP